MRKTTIFIVLICLIITSCNKGEIEKLKNHISELENENKELINTLKKVQTKKFTSSYFTTTIENEYLTVDTESKIKISLITIDTIPKFNLYSTNENFERTLIKENLNTTEFDYSFTPTSIYDNKIDLNAELILSSGVVIDFPIRGKFNVQKKNK